MYELPGSAWTSLETQEDLALAIAAATSISQYTGVSTSAGATSDDVLAVTYNGTNYLIHITASDVSTSGSGTTITIGGQYKK